MSTFAGMDGSPGRGKGNLPKHSGFSRGLNAGPSENICRTVTFCGVLSFLAVRILPAAVNVGVSP